MNNFTKSVLIGCLTYMTTVSAAIQENGIWTGKDYYDSASKIGAKNGVTYSKDPDT